MSYQEIIEGKIQLKEDWSRTVYKWHFFEKKIVFTNGCFDILHRGHIEYLSKAADLGDVLVVAVNSDASVKKLNKGSDRPINNENDRSFLLAALQFVDLVVVFNQDTPLELIKQIQPNVLVKGGDWAVDQIVGADIVKETGGEVHSIPLTENYSTTRLVESIRG